MHRVIEGLDRDDNAIIALNFMISGFVGTFHLVRVTGGLASSCAACGGRGGQGEVEVSSGGAGDGRC